MRYGTAHHHIAHANRVDWAALMTPPSEARMAVLVREEMARQDKALREALANRKMTMTDRDDERGWEPLEAGLARIRGWLAKGPPVSADRRMIFRLPYVLRLALTQGTIAPSERADWPRRVRRR